MTDEFRGRIRSLDGLRGLAAINVLLAHAFFAFGPSLLAPVYPAAQKQFPQSGAFVGRLCDWLPTLSFNGYFAVAVFFALSGVVLSGDTERDTGRLRVLRRALGRFPRLMLPCLVSALVACSLMACGAMSWIRPASELSGSTWLSQRYTQPASWYEAVLQGGWGALMRGADSYNPPFWTMRPELYGSMILFTFLYVLPSSRLRKAMFLPVCVVLIIVGDRTLALLGGCLVSSAVLVPILSCLSAGWCGLLVVVGGVLGSYHSGSGMVWLRTLWDPCAGALGLGGEAKESANVLGAIFLVSGSMGAPAVRTALAFRPLVWLARVPQLERKPEKVSEESGFSAAGGYEGNRVAGGM